MNTSLLPKTQKNTPAAPTSALSPIADIIADIRAGKMIILVDEENRENEGDLILAAEFVTPESINFMVTHCRGLVCLALTAKRCQQLGLEQMVRNNRTPHGTAFTASIEAATGVTTGISAYDRARTIQVAVAHHARPEDIVTPGHIFPLTARKGGVLVRAGHTEGGCDLAQLAGLEPAAVICEIMKDDGTMARLPDLILFAQKHGLKIGSIRDLIEYRAATEKLIEKITVKDITLPQGHFHLTAFKDKTSGDIHFALSHGGINPEKETLVRVHEPLSVLDFLNANETRHSVTVNDALSSIANTDAGVIVLLYRPQSGHELLNTLTAPPTGSTLKWDPRLFGIGAQILKELGVGKMRLLSTPYKIPSMAGFGLEITGFVEHP